MANNQNQGVYNSNANRNFANHEDANQAILRGDLGDQGPYAEEGRKLQQYYNSKPQSGSVDNDGGKNYAEINGVQSSVPFGGGSEVSSANVEFGSTLGATQQGQRSYGQGQAQGYGAHQYGAQSYGQNQGQVQGQTYMYKGVQIPIQQLAESYLNRYPTAYGQPITAVRKDGRGRIVAFRLADGNVLDYAQLMQASWDGQVTGLICQNNREGELILRTAPDTVDSNNLDNLPTF